MNVEDEQLDDATKYMIKQLNDDSKDVDYLNQVEILIAQLLFLLSKVSSHKAKKLKRFLSSLTVM